MKEWVKGGFCADVINTEISHADLKVLLVVSVLSNDCVFLYRIARLVQ